MFELKRQKVIPPHKFAFRVAKSLLLVLILVIVSLVLGMAGYHYIEDLPWIDSFLNAAMLLGGMGEIDPIKTYDGKLFAGIYAIYSGLLLLASTGILLTPIIHRIMHKFHVDSKN